MILRRATAIDTHYHPAEIAIWSDKNICPKGVASQSSTSGVFDATRAQIPVPLIQRVERSNLGKYSFTVQGELNPWYKVDLKIDGIPIKEVLLFGRVHDTDEAASNDGYEVRIGDLADPYDNPSCTTGTISTTDGNEVSCNLPGKYVGIVRPGTDSLFLVGIAIFMDCDSPQLPWDPLGGLNTSINMGQSHTFGVSLAKNLETALGVDVCGQLQLELTSLPTFCSLDALQESLTCTPTLDEHVGLHEF